MLRKLFSCALILLTPCSLLGLDAGVLLNGTGAVFLNGTQIANSSAVAPGDVIQTRETGAATLSAPGSSIVIQSNTIVRMQSGGFALDRGSVTVSTSTGMSIFSRDLKITPSSQQWGEFYVTRASGVIQITARKNSVVVSCGINSNITVNEGQQISRDDSGNCGMAAKAQGGAVPTARAPLLNSRALQYGALAVGGGLVAWALAHSDDPVSPDIP